MTTSNLEQAHEPPHAKHELLRVEHAWPWVIKSETRTTKSRVQMKKIATINH